MMNGDIGSAFLLYEAEPFLVIKPFNRFGGHGNILRSFYAQNLRLEDATRRYEWFLQKKTALPVEDRAKLMFAI